MGAIVVGRRRPSQARFALPAEDFWHPRSLKLRPGRRSGYQPKTLANINGATMVASDSMMKRGVLARSLPQVIFSLGTAPEYEP